MFHSGTSWTTTDNSGHFALEHCLDDRSSACLRRLHNSSVRYLRTEHVVSHDGVGSDSEESLGVHRDGRVKWKERVASLRTRSQSVVASAGEFVITTGPTGLLDVVRPEPSGEGH